MREQNIIDLICRHEQWTKGVVIPIYKNKGDKASPRNYRPITLLSCLSKVFTTIINNRLTTFLESNNKLSETQSGFRSGYSTADNILVLYFLIDYLKSKGKTVYCTFIDYSNAFDNLWRVGLWRKMLDLGIDGKCLRIIKNIYKDVKSCISLNGELSNFFMCEKGIRQGENLSPLLFSIFLNDVEQFLCDKNCNGVNISYEIDDIVIFLKLLILLYADDTVLMTENHKDMQTLLNFFSDYCNEWKLKINVEKTKSMIIGKCRNKLNFILNDSVIENVTFYKYLGVFFHKNGKFTYCMKQLVQIAKKAVFALRKKILLLNLSIDCQLKLFDQTILPILTYACEIWGFEKLHMIEKVHIEFLRSIIRVNKSTPLYMIYGELGRYPLEIYIKCKMIGYWARLILGKHEKLSFKAYQMLLYHFNGGDYKNNWIMSIKCILDDVGLSYIWNNQLCNNTKWIVAKVKSTLRDQYIQKWHANIDSSSKGVTYKKFKTIFCLEKYLLLLQPRQWKPIIKLRTSNHYLPVETGRWNNTERHERKCNLCNENELGDEYHYIFVCDNFRNERNLLLPKYYTKRHNMLKFNEILNCKNRKTLNNFSRFINIVINSCKP